MRPETCPYCGAAVKFRTGSTFIYGRDYGAVYACSRYPQCDAYVGCHKGTDRALGRLADHALREAKKAAHRQFDVLWQAKKKTGTPHREARGAGYAWLAQQMQLHPDDCHIGMFDVDQCRRVVEICQPYAQRIRRAEIEHAM